MDEGGLRRRAAPDDAPAKTAGKGGRADAERG